MLANESKGNSMSRWNSIDLVKFVMAFVVVAIHTEPLIYCSNENVLKIYNQILSLAVPFFFLSSGYLLAVKMTKDFNSKENILRIRYQLTKIIRMYLVWTIIYSPLAVYHYVASKTDLRSAIVLYIRGVLFVGENYNSWPLWYLLSMIYSLLMILIVLKLTRKNNGLLIMSILFSVISIGLSTLVDYEGTLSPIGEIMRKFIIYSVANGRIFQGAVYIPIGMLLARKGIFRYLNYAVFLLCFVCDFFVENSIISSYLLIVCAIALFEIIENVKLKDNSIYLVLRKMSTGIYLIHMYVWSVYYKIFYGEKTFGMDSFIVTSVFALVLSLGYLLIKKAFVGNRNENIQ